VTFCHRPTLVFLVASGLVLACGDHADEAPSEPVTEIESATIDSHPVREQIDGRAFPDGVLSLTWDDGPDLHTLALAEYLQHERIAATFFTIGEWSTASSDPGIGGHVHETGYSKMPILGQIVSMGHRVGNHTMHHALLGHISPADVVSELARAQSALDPFIHDELRLFRTPGGDWNGSASRAVDADESTARLFGPIRWDVDAKDWDASIRCNSQRPGRECERSGGRLRVRPEIIAQRYETAIDRARHGIVLMHDRVGDVGSEYALDVARTLVPWLVSRGYVFAAPVLAMSPMRTRWPVATCASLRLGDLDGNGHADACVRDHDRVTCAMSSQRKDESGLEHAGFDPIYDEHLLPAGATSFDLADVTGSGQRDLCVQTRSGIQCETGGQLRTWSRDLGDARDLRFADLDDDGKMDVCGRSGSALVCARSTGSSFEPARVWLMGAPSSFALGDVNGDGRADVCTGDLEGVECALGGHASFGPFTRWSPEPITQRVELGDLNGDGRADVCMASGTNLRCALSTGHAFTSATTWIEDGLDADPTVRAEWGRLGDINGDGRSDFCDCDGNEVRCALAP
jgi:peptidoglycan/xylan/chitin deacetylase (PgdA/CDA1 family)